MRAAVFLLALLPAVALAQQWEYKVVYLEPPLERRLEPKLTEAVQKEGGYYTNTKINAVLDALGAEGWELVGITGNNISQTAFMRRRVD